MHTSEAPVRPFEYELELQAHTELAVVVESMFEYASPVLHTVAIDAHCVSTIPVEGDDDEE